MRAALLTLALSAATLTMAKTLKELTDKNFEHDTQATTGGTTGDWFVRFCEKSSECTVKGDKTFAQWEQLADELNRRVSVAYVDL